MILGLIVWYVYILECSDKSYYTGYTNNIDERLKRHNNGRGSPHTAARLPVRLLWHEIHETKENAVQRENQIKKWSRAKKQALIEGSLKELKRLSNS